MVYMKSNRLFIKTKNKKIEYTQDKILELLFYIFRIFPVQKRKIVVSCFKNHGYCDSPKYIIQQLLKLDCTANIVWLCDFENPPEMPACIRQVPYHSIRGIYEQVTAQIWISNRRKSRYVRKRKNQYYIQTWHGGVRLKNMERAAINKLSKRYIDSAKNEIYYSKDGKQITVGQAFSDDIIELYKKYGGYPSLDMGYTVFGQVIDGMDIVDKIASTKTDDFNKPVEKVVIQSIDVTEYK